MTQTFFFLKPNLFFFIENVANRSHRDRRPSEKIVAIRKCFFSSPPTFL